MTASIHCLSQNADHGNWFFEALVMSMVQYMKKALGLKMCMEVDRKLKMF